MLDTSWLKKQKKFRPGYIKIVLYIKDYKSIKIEITFFVDLLIKLPKRFLIKF